MSSSGEAYYRSFSSGCDDSFGGGGLMNAVIKKGPVELLDFLDIDSSLEVQRKISEEKLTSIRTSKASATKCYVHQHKLESELLVLYLQKKTKKNVYNVRKLVEQVKMLTVNERKSSDATLMSFVLQYFNLLSEDLNATRAKLIQDNYKTMYLRARASITRDMRIFSYNLQVETKSKLTLTLLDGDSSQAKRCKKAIKENSNFSRLSLGSSSNSSGSGTTYNDINVLNVFKIEHSILSEKLQTAVGSTENGNIKGLFCYIPQGTLHSFGVFGLFAQKMPGLERPTKDELLGHFPSLFQRQWYSLGDTAAATTAIGSAQAAATASSAFPYLSFSRYSTPFLRDSHGDNSVLIEQGIVLALCRVLLCKVRTVSGNITETDIKEAHQLGYDAVYTSKSEEYMLLKPQYVLPEFLMHVSYEISSSSTCASPLASTTSSSSNNSSNSTMNNPADRSIIPLPKSLQYTEVAYEDDTPTSPSVSMWEAYDTVSQLLCRNTISSAKQYTNKYHNANSKRNIVASSLDSKHGIALSIDKLIKHTRKKNVHHISNHMRSFLQGSL